MATEVGTFSLRRGNCFAARVSQESDYRYLQINLKISTLIEKPFSAVCRTHHIQLRDIDTHVNNIPLDIIYDWR